ncbi:MAG: hypothetical protein V8T48_05510 [Oscillospiraceae bacterium]
MELTKKYPFELSGGQMQRLMIARIPAQAQDFAGGHEPTSMVDACSRATILDMLLQLRDEIGMTVIFITHDIGLRITFPIPFISWSMAGLWNSARRTRSSSIPRPRIPSACISDVPKIHEEMDLEHGRTEIVSAITAALRETSALNAAASSYKEYVL